MDEHEPVKRPGWPEKQLDDIPDWIRYVVVIALVVVFVIVFLVLIVPQTESRFRNVNNSLDYTPSP